MYSYHAISKSRVSVHKKKETEIVVSFLSKNLAIGKKPRGNHLCFLQSLIHSLCTQTDKKGKTKLRGGKKSKQKPHWQMQQRAKEFRGNVNTISDVALKQRECGRAI